MLALDTSVVIRYLTGDHPQQAARAKKFLEENQVFLCTTVILETEWVLRSVYGLTSVEIARTLADFAGLPNVVLEDSDVLLSALSFVREGMDFADALHLAQSRDCEAFVTFDKRLAKISAKSEYFPVQLL